MEAETEDVSARGLFIRTDALLPVGEETDLRLTLPDGTYLTFRGRVAHMLTPHAARTLGRHPGMGFELVDGETVSRIKLRAHVDSVRAGVDQLREGSEQAGRRVEGQRCRRDLDRWERGNRRDEEAGRNLLHQARG